MADWSIVAAAAVTGVTSVLSGGLGYLVAHGQARAQERQAHEQRRDDLQKSRRETYHSFLDVDRQLPARLTAGMKIGQEELQEWLDPFDHCYNAVILLGTEAVALEARELFTGYLRFYEELTDDGTSWPDAAERKAAWDKHRQLLDEARQRLIEAMRREVFESCGVRRTLAQLDNTPG